MENITREEKIFVEQMKQKVMLGQQITRKEALHLVDSPLEKLITAANEIREYFCKNAFDLCTIVNGKCGKCSEDCKYCAQSSHYHTACTDTYPLLSTKELVEGARHNKEHGVLRYSIVTSGRCLSDEEVNKVSESIKAIREEVGIAVCVSFGL